MQTVKKRTHNGRLLKAKRYYDFGEIAELLNVHLRTVQIWKKEGLRVLDDKKPFLIKGQDLRDFLKARRRSRKQPLSIGEFFCPRCRAPRKSRPDQLTAEATGRQLGRTHKQVLIRGVCEVCGQRLLLFSSDAKATEWVQHGPLSTELPESLKLVDNLTKTSSQALPKLSVGAPPNHD